MGLSGKKYRSDLKNLRTSSSNSMSAVRSEQQNRSVFLYRFLRCSHLATRCLPAFGDEQRLVLNSGRKPFLHAASPIATAAAAKMVSFPFLPILAAILFSQSLMLCPNGHCQCRASPARRSVTVWVWIRRVSGFGAVVSDALRAVMARRRCHAASPAFMPESAGIFYRYRLTFSTCFTLLKLTGNYSGEISPSTPHSSSKRIVAECCAEFYATEMMPNFATFRNLVLLFSLKVYKLISTHPARNAGWRPRVFTL